MGRGREDGGGSLCNLRASCAAGQQQRRQVSSVRPFRFLILSSRLSSHGSTPRPAGVGELMVSLGQGINILVILGQSG